MGIYNIGFFIFCIILILLTFIGVSKNILTEYGLGLLIGVLVLGIIGYDIWEDVQIREIMQKIDLTNSDTERQMLLQELTKYFGTQP
jgi:hypothetical protein